MQRLWPYVRRFHGAYVLGGALTVGYAIFFQLPPLLTRELVARLESGETAGQIRPVVAWLVAATLVFGLLRFLSRRTLFRAGRRVENELRNDFYAHLQKLPESYFAGQRTGDLMSRAVNDINNVRMLLGMGVLNIVQTPILYFAALGVMVWVNWELALWVLLPYPLFAVLARFFARRIHATVLAQQEQIGQISAAVQENASGVFVVRFCAMQERERERFERESRRLYYRQIEMAMAHTGMFAVISTVPALTQIAVLYVGSQFVSATSADLWMFYMYTLQLAFPTMMLGWVLNIVQRGLAGMVRIGEVLDELPSIRDRADAVDPARVRGAVEFSDLHLSYSGREASPALAGIDFAASQGQSVGIVGPVGSGKSTLVAAIPRLLEIPDEALRIDAHDVNRLPLRLLRSSIAMVPQDSFLFSASVADNIRYGAPDAGDDEVREAARRAHVLGDIEEELPFGFETLVGERGVTLSGGQRQRIALARALILDPAILILDDALSSVDYATEEAILKELRTSRAGRTCFIVSHRLSAVRDADLILVLDAGRVIESGGHAELLAEGGVYARTYRHQRLEAELEV
ncbi:MAG: ABC transporter ATP-binding protein [Proteobacteria bacterium]|nr:ABC transporter ATP-binding protein [Pseudomonadota bacterium]